MNYMTSCRTSLASPIRAVVDDDLVYVTERHENTGEPFTVTTLGRMKSSYLMSTRE